LGEYAKATRIEDGTKQGVNTEPAKIEVIDFLLTGIEAYILAGGTYEEMLPTADRKLQKWEKSMGT
jgi:hypothetical protein